MSAAAVAMMLSGCGVADKVTVCTTAPQSEWMDKEAFKENLLNSGYQINEFKVTEGSCYEIYGKDANDDKVEIYFNPVDGSIVKKEAH
ncbi:PepSY domain-containing protein [Lacimicrobium sp. SS2-24]|uniref:PepSY domain-containing protein n=1 Tax=Lacimicrobium sp. SS2-24 TaxID=2005569 RepID=UPI001FEFCAE4|nr:PepSY domain-containing protein [Lacimicrobium sp. SS2-24]